MCEDATSHMYSNRCRGKGGNGDDSYDVIDLDPYGTAAPFLDAAVQCVADGGLLCITSTDMPVLGGNHPETCFARYGGTGFKAAYVHEMSLRLLMHAVASSAARYGRDARPVLCCSIDFYIRIFVRIFDSPQRAKYVASKTGVVHQCVQCESFFVQPLGEVHQGGGEPVQVPAAADASKDSAAEPDAKARPPAPKADQVKFKPARVTMPGAECPECGGRVKIGGPFHIGSLYEEDFVLRCIDVCENGKETLPGVTSWKKIHGILVSMSEENPDIALYYKSSQLCKGLKLSPLPLRQLRGTLVSLGYKVSHFHREPEAIKTDAPNEVIYDLLRIWAEEHPPKSTPLPQVLKKSIGLKRPLEWKTEEDAPREKIARFLPNPEPFWGPKARARGSSVHVPSQAAEEATGQVDSKAPAAPAEPPVEE
eukprot:gnl/TRDRNA2_/TRDRNA2_131416_c0_seq2.p1 gnl/TRDRNA2_/TRDRNA2_131416_c0~~gnl/TRDRNA2_/TRDRNA2_131416_c0_seq2.p1  ORF type:complete len:481 (+),score=90.62 gnl/TRDRNA2_/TRDRNA2_131416_c0_seq2:175-1443(+)